MLGTLGLVQKLALLVASGLMVGAVAVPALNPASERSAPVQTPARETAPSDSPVAPSTYVPGGPNMPSVPFPIPGATPEDDASEEDATGDTEAVGRQHDDLSPAVFRLGFSFFLGFAIAYALKAFVKVSIIGIGLFALLMFGMQYAGLLEIRWAAIGDRYESAADWLGGQFASFRAFVLGYLPSSGSAFAGVALALKKK
ncbi:MAG: FUN14 domain-containing protein [Planctomycetota bacterium]